MNKAIKLAIEKGGYELWEPSEDTIVKDLVSQLVVLDPLFWQALGKALGWNEHRWINSHAKGSTYNYVICENCAAAKKYTKDKICVRKRNSWLDYAHQYFDLVLTGGDAEKFFEELITETIGKGGNL